MFAVVSFTWGVIVKPIYLFAICSVLALSVSAMAVPQFDTGPGGKGLAIPPFDNPVSTGQYYLSLDADSGIQNVEFSLLGEEAGFAKWNRMGIYSLEDPLEILQVIERSNEIGDSVVVTFDLDNQMAWIDENIKISIGAEFGFYLDNGGSKDKGGFFYSDTTLNDDNIIPRPVTMDIVETQDITVSFEDIQFFPEKMSFDGQIDDLVIGVSSSTTAISVVTVPEPATIALLGFGYLVFLRKKK